MDDLNKFISLILGSVTTFLMTWFWFARAAAVKAREKVIEENLEIQKRLVEMETKLQLVQQSVTPISAAFQAILIKELTHIHTPEMDELLTRVGPPSTLTKNEDARLEALLTERARDFSEEVPESERDAALILPAVMRRARVERDIIDKAQNLNAVMVSTAMAPLESGDVVVLTKLAAT